MSDDDFVSFDEKTHLVLPDWLDLFHYEPRKAAEEALLSRGRFVAAAAGGVALLAARPGFARAASLATPQLKGVARNGILRWDSAGEPVQLNPIGAANDPPVRRPTVWNSSSLFRMTNARERLAFDLARSFTAARDGSRWDVKLRSGVTWHDGTPFTANDVATTYNTIRAASYGSTWTGFLTRFREAEVVDDLTVRFNMKQAATWWLYLMAALPIVKASDALNKDLLSRKPVGTGPFMLDEWRAGDRITFKPNPRYYRKGLPRVKGLEYVIVPDANTRIINLRNHETALTSDVPPSNIAALIKAGIKVDVGLKTPNRLFYYLSGDESYKLFPPQGRPRPEWTDINNRRALAYALDRKQIIDVAYGGKATPATSTLGIGSLFYNPKIVGYGPRADVAKARAFLAAAKVKIERPIDFLVQGTAAGPTLDAATIMQANWRAIGIESNIQALDAAAMAPLTRTQNFDVAMLSTVTGASSGRSPNSWLVFLTPGTSAFHYRNYPPELQENIDQINGGLDRKKVIAAFDWLQRFETDHCTTVGVCYPDYYEAEGVPLDDYGVINLGYLPYRVEEARIVGYKG